MGEHPRCRGCLAWKAGLSILESALAGQVRRAIRLGAATARIPAAAPITEAVPAGPGGPGAEAPAQEEGPAAAPSDAAAVEPLEPGGVTGRPETVATPAAPVAGKEVKAAMAVEPSGQAAVRPQATAAGPVQMGAGPKVAPEIMAVLAALVRPRGDTRGPIVPALTALAVFCARVLEAPNTGSGATVVAAVRTAMKTVETSKEEDGLLLVLEPAPTVLVVETGPLAGIPTVRGVGPVPLRNAVAHATRVVGVLTVGAKVACPRQLVRPADLVLGGPLAPQGQQVVVAPVVGAARPPNTRAHGGHVLSRTPSMTTPRTGKAVARVSPCGPTEPTDDGLRLGGRRQRPGNAGPGPRRLVALPTAAHTE